MSATPAQRIKALEEERDAIAQEAQDHGRRIGELEDRLAALESRLAGQLGLRPE